MKHNFKDMTGQYVGKTFVIRYYDTGTAGCARWLCRCSCGREVIKYGTSLRFVGASNCNGCTNNAKKSHEKIKDKNLTDPRVMFFHSKMVCNTKS